MGRRPENDRHLHGGMQDGCPRDPGGDRPHGAPPTRGAAVAAATAGVFGVMEGLPLLFTDRQTLALPRRPEHDKVVTLIRLLIAAPAASRTIACRCADTQCLSAVAAIRVESGTSSSTESGRRGAHRRS